MMKEKLTAALGGFGAILWFVFSALYCFSPFLILRLPVWLELLLFLAMFTLPIVGEIIRIVLYVWAIIVSLGRPIDAITIVFFVIAAIYFFTTLVPLVLSLFHKKDEYDD